MLVIYLITIALVLTISLIKLTTVLTFAWKQAQIFRLSSRFSCLRSSSLSTFFSSLLPIKILIVLTRTHNQAHYCWTNAIGRFINLIEKKVISDPLGPKYSKGVKPTKTSVWSGCFKRWKKVEKFFKIVQKTTYKIAFCIFFLLACHRDLKSNHNQKIHNIKRSRKRQNQP